MLLRFPPGVVFEIKVTETVDGKTRILRRDIFEALPDYQTETQDYRDAQGNVLGRLAYAMKAGFLIGDNLVYYARQLGLPDAVPMETKLGEWRPTDGLGWPTMEKHSGTMYVRCIMRGQESPPEEVPVAKEWSGK
jgi:hypothetical protein